MVRATTMLLALFAACTSTTPPPQAEPKPKVAPSPAPTPPQPPLAGTANVEADTAPPEPMPGQWTCASDADCAQTCALGAVSRAWLAHNQDADPCDDGCGWKSGKQACRDGECVTLTEDGDIDEACTKRPVPPAR